MNIGLIGCGKWGKLVLRDLVRLECRVTVLAIDDSSRLHAQTYGASRLVTTMAALTGQDGYILCTPSDVRYTLIQTLVQLEPSALIFTEKPLCTNSEQAQQLSDKLPHSLFMMDKWRYHAGVLALKNLLITNEFGPVQSISTRRLSNGVSYSDLDTVWLLTPHDLSIVLELLGYLPKPKAAMIDNTGGRRRGIQATLGTHPQVRLEVTDRHTSSVREVTVCFEQAVAVLSNSHEGYLFIQPTTHTNSPDSTPDKRPFTLNEPLFDELQAFLAFVDGGAAPKSSGADGALVVKTIVQLLALDSKQYDPTPDPAPGCRAYPTPDPPR